MLVKIRLIPNDMVMIGSLPNFIIRKEFSDFSGYTGFILGTDLIQVWVMIAGANGNNHMQMIGHDNKFYNIQPIIIIFQL